MKRYELLILEWDLGIPKETILREEMGGFSKGGLIGAGVGGGLGVISAARNYLKQRAVLQNQMAECVDDQCRMQIKAKLDALKSNSIRSGLGRGMAGAAGGAVVGAGVGTGIQIGKGAYNINSLENGVGMDVDAAKNVPGSPNIRSATTLGDEAWKVDRDEGGNPYAKAILAKTIYDMGSPETTKEVNQILDGGVNYRRK